MRGQQRGLSSRLRRGRLADEADGPAAVRGQRHRSLGRQPNISASPYQVKRFFILLRK